MTTVIADASIVSKGYGVVAYQIFNKGSKIKADRFNRRFRFGESALLELLAVITAIKDLPDKQLLVVTDSDQVINLINGTYTGKIEGNWGEAVGESRKFVAGKLVVARRPDESLFTLHKGVHKAAITLARKLNRTKFKALT